MYVCMNYILWFIFEYHFVLFNFIFRFFVKFICQVVYNYSEVALPEVPFTQAVKPGKILIHITYRIFFCIQIVNILLDNKEKKSIIIVNIDFFY